MARKSLERSLSRRVSQDKSYDSDDSISLTSTVSSQHGSDTEYEVDKVLAEAKFDDGTRYLVSWVGYPLERSSWEPKSSFRDDLTLRLWKKAKQDVASGKKKPFDLDAFEKQLDTTNAARLERKRRRKAKKRRKGIRVSSDEDSSYEDNGISKDKTLPRSTSQKRRRNGRDSAGSAPSSDSDEPLFHRARKSSKPSINDDKTEHDSVSKDLLVQEALHSEEKELEKELDKALRESRRTSLAETGRPESTDPKDRAPQSEQEKSKTNSSIEPARSSPLKPAVPGSAKPSTAPNTSLVSAGKKSTNQSVESGSSERAPMPASKSGTEKRVVIRTSPPVPTAFGLSRKNVLGNWRKLPQPRRPSLPAPAQVDPESSTLYKTARSKRRAELRSRREPPPSADALQLFNPARNLAAGAALSTVPEQRNDPDNDEHTEMSLVASPPSIQNNMDDVHEHGATACENNGEAHEKGPDPSSAGTKDGSATSPKQRDDYLQALERVKELAAKAKAGKKDASHTTDGSKNTRVRLSPPRRRISLEEYQAKNREKQLVREQLPDATADRQSRIDISRSSRERSLSPPRRRVSLEEYKNKSKENQIERERYFEAAQDHRGQVGPRLAGPKFPRAFAVSRFGQRLAKGRFWEIGDCLVRMNYDKPSKPIGDVLLKGLGQHINRKLVQLKQDHVIQVDFVDLCELPQLESLMEKQVMKIRAPPTQPHTYIYPPLPYLVLAYFFSGPILYLHISFRSPSCMTRAISRVLQILSPR